MAFMHRPLPNRGVSDTSDDAAEAQYRVMRAMSPSRKVALVEDANRTVERLRPRMRAADRLFWLTLRRIWPRWKAALVIIQPDTVVRWQ